MDWTSFISYTGLGWVIGASASDYIHFGCIRKDKFLFPFALFLALVVVDIAGRIQ